MRGRGRGYRGGHARYELGVAAEHRPPQTVLNLGLVGPEVP